MGLLKLMKFVSWNASPLSHSTAYTPPAPNLLQPLLINHGTHFL